jgi:hypothetical protein
MTFDEYTIRNTPFRLRNLHSFGNAPVVQVLDSRGRHIATIAEDGPFSFLFREFAARDMVRAVNSHNAMYEALERMTRIVEARLREEFGREDVLKQAKEALKLAEGGTNDI